MFKYQVLLQGEPENCFGMSCCSTPQENLTAVSSHVTTCWAGKADTLNHTMKANTQTDKTNLPSVTFTTLTTLTVLKQLSLLFLHMLKHHKVAD